jgi:hypothetical protein
MVDSEASRSHPLAQDPYPADTKLEIGILPVSEDETFRAAADEVAAIPKGTIDPVYEAKARVLNHAVIQPEASSPPPPPSQEPPFVGHIVMAQRLIAPRSKKSGWGGISGSCSSSSASAGQTTTYGPL